MSIPQKHTVVIVGCGIAGPTLALTILKHPQLSTLYTPVLLDRLPAASAYFAGAAVVLSSNALHPLMQLGIHDAVWDASEEALTTTMWRGRSSAQPGRRLNSLQNPNWSSDIGSGLRTIERGVLMRLLVDAVAALGGEVLWGAKVAALEQTPAGVDVVLSDGRRRSAALVVGADGAWSVVRKHIIGDGDWKPVFMNASVIYGISRRPAAGTDDEVLGHGHAVLLDIGGVSTWALPGGRQFWCVSVLEPGPPDARSDVVENSEYGHITTGGYSLESTEALLRRFDAYWYPRVGACGALFRDSEKIVRAPLWQRVFEAAETTNAGTDANMLVLGDAGRVMLPTSGQGACMAIEDATVFANALLNNPPAPTAPKPSFAAALHEYSAQRIPRSKSIAKQAYWTGIAFMAERWWWRWLRDLFVAWMPMERDPKGKMQRGEKVRDLGEWLHGARYEVRMRVEGETVE